MEIILELLRLSATLSSKYPLQINQRDDRKKWIKKTEINNRGINIERKIQYFLWKMYAANMSAFSLEPLLKQAF